MQTVRNPVLFVVGDEPKHEQASSRGFVSGAFVDRVDGVVLRISAWVAHPGKSDDLTDDCVARRRVQKSFPQAVQLAQHILHSTLATVISSGACG